MANEEKTTAELEQQRKAQQQQMMMMQRMQKIQMVGNIINQMDPTNVLKAICSQFGVSLSITSNPWYSQSLTQCIYNSLLKGALDDDTMKDIFNALNNAISLTNNIRMFGSFGGNNMMGGMGMGMPGMNPMMMGNMNPMMGMGMMNPMMGGMNPMMGMGMMNPMMGMGVSQQQTADTADSDKLKKFVEQNIWNADPLVFIQTLITNGIDVDFSEDQNFRNTTNQCIIAAISSVNQPMQFEYICNIVGSLYYTNMQQQYQDKMKQNGGNTQNNMMGGLMNPMMGGMMNPMMGGMMNPMMVGGMNPMMGGMMSGMQTGFDAGSQNNMMGGLMNPMMGGMMNPMMGMGMGMPGMNQFGAAGTGSNGAFF